MEAKDTVMEILLQEADACRGRASERRRFIEERLKAQAEITWPIARKAGYDEALAQLAEMTEECEQMGRREVVELIDNTGLIEHTDSPLHEVGATILDCPACCWYAYKKERWEL